MHRVATLKNANIRLGACVVRNCSIREWSSMRLIGLLSAYNRKMLWVTASIL